MLLDHTTTIVTTAGKTTRDRFITETGYLANFPAPIKTFERTKLQTTSADVTTQSSSTLYQGMRIRLTP
jgi:hypothetical protein